MDGGMQKGLSVGPFKLQPLAQIPGMRSLSRVRKARFIANFGTVLVRILLATLRVRVIDQVGLMGQPHDKPFIWIFWHNRLMLFPHLIERYLNQRRTAALTSASKDELQKVITLLKAADYDFPLQFINYR